MTKAGEADPVPRRVGLRSWAGVFFRGMAMGVAELVPGVSGGTIAFVTGIYVELVSSLARFRLESAPILLRRGPAAFWHDHNLGFLVTLGLGMAASVLLFARLLHELIGAVPTVIWGFFFGLIAASVVQIGRGRSGRHLIGAGSLGLLSGLLLTQVNPGEGDPATWLYFFGGMAAVSAWLLPAVSGSFLLLALGLYGGVLEALSEGHWAVLLTLGAGCVVGLLAFARVLAWLMDTYREPVLATLTGFMAGSLTRLWPWRYEGQLFTPAGFEDVSGEPALLAAAVLAAAGGVFVLWLLSRLE